MLKLSKSIVIVIDKYLSFSKYRQDIANTYVGIYYYVYNYIIKDVVT